MSKINYDRVEAIRKAAAFANALQTARHQIALLTLQRDSQAILNLVTERS